MPGKPKKERKPELPQHVQVGRMKYARMVQPRYVSAGWTAAGTPIAYTLTPEGLELVAQRAKAGDTLTSLAHRLGMTRDAFADLRKRQPEAEEAFRVGRGSVVSQMTNVLVNKALAGDTVSLIFALKTIGGFREGTPIEGSAPAVSINISIPAPLPADEVIKIIGRLPEPTDEESEL